MRERSLFRWVNPASETVFIDLKEEQDQSITLSLAAMDDSKLNSIYHEFISYLESLNIEFNHHPSEDNTKKIKISYGLDLLKLYAALFGYLDIQPKTKSAEKFLEDKFEFSIKDSMQKESAYIWSLHDIQSNLNGEMFIKTPSISDFREKKGKVKIKIKLHQANDGKISIADLQKTLQKLQDLFTAQNMSFNISLDELTQRTLANIEKLAQEDAELDILKQNIEPGVISLEIDSPTEKDQQKIMSTLLSTGEINVQSERSARMINIRNAPISVGKKTHPRYDLRINEARKLYAQFGPGSVLDNSENASIETKPLSEEVAKFELDPNTLDLDLPGYLILKLNKYANKFEAEFSLIGFSGGVEYPVALDEVKLVEVKNCIQQRLAAKKANFEIKADATGKVICKFNKGSARSHIENMVALMSLIPSTYLQSKENQSFVKAFGPSSFYGQTEAVFQQIVADLETKSLASKRELPEVPAILALAMKYADSLTKRDVSDLYKLELLISYLKGLAEYAFQKEHAGKFVDLGVAINAAYFKYLPPQFYEKIRPVSIEAISQTIAEHLSSSPTPSPRSSVNLTNENDFQENAVAESTIVEEDLNKDESPIVIEDKSQENSLNNRYGYVLAQNIPDPHAKLDVTKPFVAVYTHQTGSNIYKLEVKKDTYLNDYSYLDSKNETRNTLSLTIYAASLDVTNIVKTFSNEVKAVSDLLLKHGVQFRLIESDKVCKFIFDAESEKDISAILATLLQDRNISLGSARKTLYAAEKITGVESTQNTTTIVTSETGVLLDKFGPKSLYGQTIVKFDSFIDELNKELTDYNKKFMKKKGHVGLKTSELLQSCIEAFQAHPLSRAEYIVANVKGAIEFIQQTEPSLVKALTKAMKVLPSEFVEKIKPSDFKKIYIIDLPTNDEANNFVDALQKAFAKYEKGGSHYKKSDMRAKTIALLKGFMKQFTQESLSLESLIAYVKGMVEFTKQHHVVNGGFLSNMRESNLVIVLKDVLKILPVDYVDSIKSIEISINDLQAVKVDSRNGSTYSSRSSSPNASQFFSGSSREQSPRSSGEFKQQEPNNNNNQGSNVRSANILLKKQ